MITDKEKRQYKKANTINRVYLAGGCFWCLDAVFRSIDGVLTVVCGYANGNKEIGFVNYDVVCRGNSGYAEVVEIEFDPAIIGFTDLLNIFFKIHDGTQLNRQGADIGSQYRSGIFYCDEWQAEQALNVVKTLKNSNEIVTEIKPLENFIVAEDAHQNYFNRHPEQGYCQFVIAPKLSQIL